MLHPHDFFHRSPQQVGNPETEKEHHKDTIVQTSPGYSPPVEIPRAEEADQPDDENDIEDSPSRELSGVYPVGQCSSSQYQVHTSCFSSKNLQDGQGNDFDMSGGNPAVQGDSRDFKVPDEDIGAGVGGGSTAMPTGKDVAATAYR